MANIDAKDQVVQDEKPARNFEKHPEFGLEKTPSAVIEDSDYTGAEAKTDPAEIALVRKIDWRLMVRIIACGWDERIDRNLAHAMHDVFPQLCW